MTTTDQDDTAVRLEELYRDYIDAFNRKDAKAVAGHYRLPYLELGGPEPVTVFADAEAATAHMAAGIEALMQAGWASTRVDSARGVPLAEGAALLAVRVSQLAQDDTVLRSVDVLYTLALDGGEWRFVSYVYLGEGFTLPLA